MDKTQLLENMKTISETLLIENKNPELNFTFVELQNLRLFSHDIDKVSKALINKAAPPIHGESYE